MICIYEDMFQPFTEHNRIIYNKLQEKFGKENVFLSIKEGKKKYLSLEKRMYLAEKYFGIGKFLKIDEKKVEKIKENTINSDVPIVFFSENVKENLIESYDGLVPNNIYHSRCPDGLVLGKKNFNNDVIPLYMSKINDPDKVCGLFNKIFPNQTPDNLYNIYFDLVSEMTFTGGIAPATKPAFLTRRQFKKFGEVRKIVPKKKKVNRSGFYKHSIPENVDKDKIFIIDMTGSVYKLEGRTKIVKVNNEDIPNDAFFISN